MSFGKYITKRLLAMIPVVLIVLSLTFIFSRMGENDAAELILSARGLKWTLEQYQALYHQLGLDRPIIVQYFEYLGQLFTGQWGESLNYSPGEPVFSLIWKRLPITIDLTLFTVILSSYLGIKIGVISSRHRNKIQDTLARGFALVGTTVPIYILGIFFQAIFATQLNLVDPTGYQTSGWGRPPIVTGFYWIDSLIAGQLYRVPDYFAHLILPVSCLTIITLASIVRQTRSSMLEVLEQDYIRTARAKGCKEKDVIHKHALKNALMPTVTIIGFNIAGLLGGAVLTEYTFGLDGMGALYLFAVTQYDYYLLNAIVFIFTMILIFTTLITDLLYSYLDPRIRI